jgi:hypothetical protein
MAITQPSENMERLLRSPTPAGQRFRERGRASPTAGRELFTEAILQKDDSGTARVNDEVGPLYDARTTPQMTGLAVVSYEDNNDWTFRCLPADFVYHRLYFKITDHVIAPTSATAPSTM